MSESLLVEARRELARLPAVLEALLAGLDPPDARTRPAPDEWSPVEILCHLRDEETEEQREPIRQEAELKTARRVPRECKAPGPAEGGFRNKLEEVGKEEDGQYR